MRNTALRAGAVLVLLAVAACDDAPPTEAPMAPVPEAGAVIGVDNPLYTPPVDVPYDVPQWATPSSSCPLPEAPPAPTAP